MLDQILSKIKSELKPKLEKKGVPPAKAGQAIGVAKNDITDVFKSEAMAGNAEGILNLFNGKQSMASSSIVQEIISKYAGSLVSKIGINPAIASTVAGFAIPWIMSKMNSETPSEGITKKDLMDMVGSDVKDKIGDGLKGKLGNLFN